MDDSGQQKLIPGAGATGNGDAKQNGHSAANGHASGPNGAPGSGVESAEVPVLVAGTPPGPGGPALPASPASAAQGAPRLGRVTRRAWPLRSRSGGAPSARADADPSDSHPLHLLISALAITLVLSLVMAVPILPGQVEITPGMPATRDILSPGFLSYSSKVLTDRARQQAVNDPANEVWVQDTNVVQVQRATLLNNLLVVDQVRANEVMDAATRRQRLAGLSGLALSDEQVNTLVSMPEGDYRYWRDNAVIPAFDNVMRNRRITSSVEAAAARNGLGDVLVPGLTPEQKDVAVAFVSPLVMVNMRLDEEQTKQRRDSAAANVKPVVSTVQKGEAILRQGDLATPEAIEKMQQAGLLSKGISPANALGTTGIVAVLVLLLHAYMYRFAPGVWRRRRQLLLVGILLVFTVAVSAMLLPGHTILPYLLPVAAVSMLLSVLLNPNLAMVVTVVASLLVGMAAGATMSMELPVYYFVGGLAGILSLTHVERVSAYARAGFYISVASFMAALMLKVLTAGAIDLELVGTLALAAAFNGGISASVTYATFSMLGMLFGITTPMHLMELAHPDQPLLRRLMREAPGTYHHSLVVGNLAEHAAEMIGADPLLTRVCAFYHDIGKVVRPYYFIDNQSGIGNIHDDLNPWESAAIIAQHVNDGVRLGREHRLPKKVLDAIPQHHGTMLIRFFYFRALQVDPNASQDAFRYAGPRPQSKENAILMLADGVEATVRSMAQSGALDKKSERNSDASESPALYDDRASLPDDTVAQVVHRVVSERIEDGQLDECDLTVRDIARIQEAFVSMLKGIYHPRVTYPEQPKEHTPAQGEGPVAAHGPAGTNGHALPAPAAVPAVHATIPREAGEPPRIELPVADTGPEAKSSHG